MCKIILFYLILFPTTDVLATKRIKAKGSTTLLPLVKDSTKAFAKRTKQVIVAYGGSSELGVEHALKGGLGIVSRNLNAREINLGAVATTIGFDGIAILVNPEKKVNTITLSKLKKIYSGEISKWSQIQSNLPNENILLIGPSEDLVKQETFKSLLGYKKKTTNSIIGYKSFEDLSLNLISNKSAIAWVPLGYYIVYRVKHKHQKFKAIAIDSKQPIVNDLANKSYPLIRPLNLVTKGQASGQIKYFINFLKGPIGQRSVKRHGFVKIVDVSKTVEDQ